MSTIVAPERTVEQRFAALAHANSIRVGRAKLRRTMTAEKAAAILIGPPTIYTNGWKVLGLLCAIPKFGPVKAQRLLTAHRVSHSKTVGGLSDRQRYELAKALS